MSVYKRNKKDFSWAKSKNMGDLCLPKYNKVYLLYWKMPSLRVCRGEAHYVTELENITLEHKTNGTYEFMQNESLFMSILFTQILEFLHTDKGYKQDAVVGQAWISLIQEARWNDKV